MTSTSSKYSWIGFIVLLIVCFTAAGVGSVATFPKIENWYASLVKPSWTPPDWIFGPVWSILYLSMAIAAWLVWRQSGFLSIPLAIFVMQLILNAAWSWLFFGLQNPGIAFIEILFLWTAIAATIMTFWQRSALAGLLLVPYFCWVTFACFLNFAIWRLNAGL